MSSNTRSALSQDLETQTPQYNSDDEPTSSFRPRNITSSTPSTQFSGSTKQGKMTLTQRMEDLERRAVETASLQEQRSRQMEIALQHITSMLAARSPAYSPPIPSRNEPRNPSEADNPLPTVENVSDARRLTTHGPKPRSQQIRTEMSGVRQSPEPVIRDATDSYQTPYPQSHFRKSQLTERIIALEDGTAPTFIQWKISIRDRLEVNEDHYPTERARKALVWGATNGQAKEYLEPRYLSDTHDYATAEEMINLLATYFLTGNETEEKRRDFHALRQRETEPFSDFKARFISLAIQGKVAESEWFFYLWEKITERLRYAAGPVKIMWNSNFTTAVQHLTSICRERRANTTRGSVKSNTTHANKKPMGMSTGAAQQSNYRSSPARPFVPSGNSHPNASRSLTPANRPGTARVPTPDKGATSRTDVVCYGCGKTGHYKSECPLGPLVKEIAGTNGDLDEDLEEKQEEDPESDMIREENGEA